MENTNRFDPESQDVVAALEAGFKIGQHDLEVREFGGGPPILTRSGETVLSLEKFLARPKLRRATVDTRTPAAFVGYLKAFSEPSSRVFWWEPDMKVTGIVDYHDARDVIQALGVQNGAGLHRVIFEATKTPDWAEWVGIDGQLLDQVRFAEFIEDHLDTIAEPSGATLFELATRFSVGRTLSFRSGVRLDSGTVQLTYDEGEASDQVKIPTEMTLMVAPFEGTIPRPVKVRLRYRIGQGDSAGKLTMGIVIVRRQEVIRQAFMDLVKEIIDGTTVPVLEASVRGSFFG